MASSSAPKAGQRPGGGPHRAVVEPGVLAEAEGGVPGLELGAPAGRRPPPCRRGRRPAGRTTCGEPEAAPGSAVQRVRTRADSAALWSPPAPGSGPCPAVFRDARSSADPSRLRRPARRPPAFGDLAQPSGWLLVPIGGALLRLPLLGSDFSSLRWMPPRGAGACGHHARTRSDACVRTLERLDLADATPAARAQLRRRPRRRSPRSPEGYSWSGVSPFATASTQSTAASER